MTALARTLDAPRPGVFAAFDPATHRPAPYRGVLAELFAGLCRLGLRLAGWTLEGDWPADPRLVVCCAPHTSNVDGVLMLVAAGAWRVRLSWMGKASLTKGPFGGLVRWAGCVPIDRSARHDVVRAMAAALKGAERMILAIPPEGTRGRAEIWKSGFYHIADAAGVPLVLAVLDYRTRTMRLAGALTPGGDYAADLPLILAPYAKAVGRHPEDFALSA